MFLQTDFCEVILGNLEFLSIHTLSTIHTQQINSASLDGTSRFIGGFIGVPTEILGVLRIWVVDSGVMGELEGFWGLG